MTEGLSAEPGLDEGSDAGNDLSWPPWLEDLRDRDKVRAIVAAVARCYASNHTLGHGCEQHCTQAMAEVFLLKLLPPAGQPCDEHAEPALPEGIYGRVELPGYRNHTGWVTEETRFGVQMAVVRDWDGRVVAEVAPGPLCQFVHLPTPLKRPEPGPQRLALPPGRDPWGDGLDDEEAF